LIDSPAWLRGGVVKKSNGCAHGDLLHFNGWGFSFAFIIPAPIVFDCCGYAMSREWPDMDIVGMGRAAHALAPVASDLIRKIGIGVR